MTDVWDLAAYVEAHPTNHEQRWRLAKKLYTSWEYRLALEHLLILKNELEPRENVMRYLAATYYRLGRFEESIKALKDALEVWPNDISMREQLARTQAEAGHNEDALKTWRILAKIDESHSFAQQAIARLEKVVEEEAKAKATSMQPANTASVADGDGAPPKEVVCPKCGEKNTAEFKHCWKCNAQLTHSEDFLDGVVSKPEKTEPMRYPYPTVIGIGIAGLVALAAYCTMRGFAEVRGFETDPAASLSVVAFLKLRLLWTHVGAGATLVVVWPIAWRVAAYIANVENRVYNEPLYQSGAVMALIAYALSWAPWSFIGLAIAVPAILSALIAFLALRIKPGEAFKVWMWQLGLAAIVVALVVVLAAGPGLLIEANKIAAYARNSGIREIYQGTLAAPGDIHVQWTSTGSKWLDREAGSSSVTITPAPHERRVLLETLRGDDSLSFKPVREETHTESFSPVAIGVPYRLDVRSDEAIDVGVKVWSLLPFTVELASRRENSTASPPASPGPPQ